VEFYHLRSFVVVAKTQNLTLAAKQLYTTPPAVSAHIKTLEDELNTQLFNRTSKGMILTEKGSQLLLKAQKTLDSATDMVNLALENQQQIIGHCKLGINQTPDNLKLNNLLCDLTEHCPGISTEIINSASGVTLKAIDMQELDAGFVYGPISDEFYGIAIKQQQITTIAPNHYNLHSGTTINELKQQPWITMGQDCPFDSQLKNYFANQINSVTQSDNEHSRVELVLSGLGLSFCEQELAKHYQQQDKLSVLAQLDFTAELMFVVKKQRCNEPLIKAILQEVRTCWDIKL